MFLIVGTCQSQKKGTLRTNEDDGNAGQCVFPFTHSGVTYTACASPEEYGGVGWCAWDHEYAGYFSGRWGYCTSECPLGRKNINKIKNEHKI